MTTQGLELYREYPEPEEGTIAQSIISLMEGQMKEISAPSKTLRDVHSKTHGCVKGFFIVDPDLPEDLRIGVFQPSHRYHSWIRFSNAGGLAPVGGVAPDIKRDARGMAIKLLEVPGQKLLEDEKNASTQDFLLFTPQMFFTAGPGDFYDLMVALVKSKLALAWYLIKNPSVLIALFRSLKKHANLLELEYYSAVPYAFGARAVKYSVRPRNPGTSEIPQHPASDYLRLRLIEQLHESAAEFDFMIQFQTDPYQMPIENALKVWSQSLSPFRKVATILIPLQSFDSAEQVRCCENSSFTPWHCLPEHRPLGSVSRVRKVVYAAISEFRHKRNEIPRHEPTGNEPCTKSASH